MHAKVLKSQPEQVIDLSIILTDSTVKHLTKHSTIIDALRQTLTLTTADSNWTPINEMRGRLLCAQPLLGDSRPTP